MERSSAAYSFFDSHAFTIITTLFIVFSIIIILFFLYKRACKKLIGNIYYKREFSEFGVYEGDEVILTETIYNDSSMPMLFVYAQSYLYPELKLPYYDYKDKDAMQLFQSKYTLLMPYMQIRRKHTIKCIKRGKYNLESAEIFLSGSACYTQSQAVLYVYPKILPTPSLTLPAGILMGDSASRRMLYRDPFSFNGVRQYSYGDPFNSINFKATAKAFAASANPLRVNALDYASNRTFLIYINFQNNPSVPIPTKTFTAMLESAMSYSADLIRISLENGYRIGLKTNGKSVTSEKGLDFEIQSGEIHTREMLCAMSKAINSASISFPNLLVQSIKKAIQNTEIFIFSAYCDNEIDKCIYALRNLGNSVNFIILQNEEENEK